MIYRSRIFNWLWLNSLLKEASYWHSSDTIDGSTKGPKILTNKRRIVQHCSCKLCIYMFNIVLCPSQRKKEPFFYSKQSSSFPVTSWVEIILWWLLEVEAISGHRTFQPAQENCHPARSWPLELLILGLVPHEAFKSWWLKLLLWRPSHPREN